MLIYALFLAPFVLTAYFAANTDIPWGVAASVGYALCMFLAWCFVSGDDIGA